VKVTDKLHTTAILTAVPTGYDPEPGLDLSKNIKIFFSYLESNPVLFNALWLLYRVFYICICTLFFPFLKTLSITAWFTYIYLNEKWLHVSELIRNRVKEIVSVIASY